MQEINKLKSRRVLLVKFPNNILNIRVKFLLTCKTHEMKYVIKEILIKVIKTHNAMNVF